MLETVRRRSDLRIMRPDELLSQAPLVYKYFWKHICVLLEDIGQNQEKLRFLNVLSSPDLLERRLRRIKESNCLQAIVDEIGEIADPQELDGRLIDAWAEIRVLDQIVREGFTDPQKVESIGDLQASKNGRRYVIQVKRIRSSYAAQVEKRNPPHARDASPYGSLDDIHERLDEPISYYFWDAIEEKNRAFKNWPGSTDSRVVALVSSDERISDPMARHIACQQIAKGVFDLLSIYFDELWWFPDLSNGCRIVLGEDFASTRCAADWCDDVYKPDGWDSRPVQLNPVDLSNNLP